MPLWHHPMSACVVRSAESHGVTELAPSRADQGLAHCGWNAMWVWIQAVNRTVPSTHGCIVNYLESHSQRRKASAASWQGCPEVLIGSLSHAHHPLTPSVRAVCPQNSRPPPSVRNLPWPAQPSQARIIGHSVGEAKVLAGDRESREPTCRATSGERQWLLTGNARAVCCLLLPCCGSTLLPSPRLLQVRQQVLHF